MAYLVAVTDRSLKSSPLELTAFCVRGEPISYADAIRGQFTPIKSGDAWGPPWSTTWFHVRGRVPEAWLGRRVVAQFDLGFAGPTGFTCEALAWNEGKPWRGVDPNHRWLPIHGPEVDFYLEAAANPRATEHGVEPAPSMLALREAPEPAFILREAVLAIHKPDSAGVGEASLDHSHKITAVGHAHIDTAWEWPLREAKRKVARSWSTQLALMDQYPDYVFAASQPAQYQWMKETYPDIYRRIKEKVAAGQWEPVGAMWVEADCNLPSGESLVRQLLHGKRFFMREFGYETRVLWLPDVFGYPGNLPQLMAAAGCEFFARASVEAKDLTTAPGELYFELHRGTYTSQSRTKWWNRRAQMVLRDAEMWSVGAGDEYPRGELEAMWKTALLNQFHDILPGSSIDWVYEDNVNDLRQVVAGAENVAARALETIAGDGEGVAVFNSTSHNRAGAPPYGWAVHASRPEPAPMSIAAGRMENDILRIEWNQLGLLTSIWDKEAGLEVLRAPGNLFQLHDDNPARWDAWDLDLSYLDTVQDLTDLEAVHLDPDAVRFVRRFGESQLWQRMVLDGRVLRFETQVDWHERHKMLKVAFPVTISSPKATYEVQFGHVEL